MNSPEMSNQRSEDWLPSGWSVNVRVRRSGKKDKQYYAPSGLRFNSKVEVTRYLKTMEGGSPQPTVEKHEDVASARGKDDKVGIKESVENHNCKKVERSSSGSGEMHNAGLKKSINCVFSPVQDNENTMIKENVAKIEGPGPAASFECKDHKNVNAQEFEKNAFGQIKQIASLENIKTSPKHGPKVVVERVVAEGLPAGWIKEVKLTKKKKTIRRDPYYIDPVSGYIFHSLRDVNRYLATGDIGRLASKPKEESPIVEELGNDRTSSPSEAKRQKLENSGVEGTEDESYELMMLEAVHKEVTAPPPSMDGSAETSETTKTKQATPKSQKKKSSDMPRRTSSRLAGVMADPQVQVTRTRNRVKDEELSSGSQKKRVKRGKIMSKSINELCSPVEDEGKKLSCNVVAKEEVALPFELPSGDILSDPCIEFAIKTLTGVSFDTSTAIKSCSSAEQQPTSNNSRFEKVPLPFGEDPCIEFAIKTLTGAIPVDFDSDIPDLMRQSQIQERTESNVGMDNFMLWQHSEAANNNSFRQQSGVGPASQRPSGSIR